MAFLILVKIVVCGNLGVFIQAHPGLLCLEEKAWVRLFFEQMDIVRSAPSIEHCRVAMA